MPTRQHNQQKNRIDIYSVRDYVTNRLAGINGVIGTGVNTSTQNIIIYVNMDDQYVIDHVYQELGTSEPYGYRLQFITTGTVKFF